MGKCSIPRSNPGGGVERVGDIKVTTRTSLGDKWVLCNGDPKDGSEAIIPDITDEQCWTNINGPYPTSDSSEGFHMNQAVYAGNGIWYSPDVNMGSRELRIYKYDQNTGEVSGVYYSPVDDALAYLQSDGFTHICYNKNKNTLAVCYTHDSSYSDIDVDNSGLYIFIDFIDCSTFTKIGSTSLNFDDIAGYCGANKTNGEVVWNKDIKMIYNGYRVVFFVSFETIFYDGELADYVENSGGCYTAFLTAEYEDIINGAPVWISTAINDGEYSSNYNNFLTDYIEIGSSVYALVDIHCPEWNYYSLARFNIETGVYTDLSNALSIYGNDGFNEQINGARFTTDGTNLYMLANNDIICIANTGDITRYTDADAIGSNGEEHEEANVFFYYNGTIYIAHTDDAATYDVSSKFATLADGAFGKYKDTIVTSSNEIAKSNCVFTSYTNGTENCYWFNGNDTVERWPIITVDEEAYCFMKIKE